MSQDTATTIDKPHTQHLPLAWGLQPPPEAQIAWGGRAIYKLQDNPTIRRGGRVVSRASTTASIDIPHDRQSGAFTPGVTERDRKLFDIWLNKKGLPELRRACVKQYVTSDSNDEITVEQDKYRLKASPRASYGYLYIVAWMVA
jgi:hypothetical protein